MFENNLYLSNKVMRGVQSKNLAYSGRPPINMKLHQTYNLQLSQMYFDLKPNNIVEFKRRKRRIVK